MHSSQSANGKFLKWIFYLGLGCLFAVWFYLCSTNWITDSEFWPITLSGHLDQWRHHPSLIYKSVFSLSLSWIYIFDLNSAEHIQVAKAFYAFLGLVYFYLFYRVCKVHVGFKKSVLLVLTLLVSVTGFSQIGVIRSDFLASLIGLLGVLVLMSERYTLRSKVLLIVGVWTLMFLTTPKSVYLLIPMGILAVEFISFRPALRTLNRILVSIILCLLLFLIVDLGLDQKLSSAIASAYYHNKNAYGALSSGMTGFRFIGWYLIHDAPLYAMILMLILRQFQLGVREKNARMKLFSIFGFCIFIFVSFHEPKLPFFLGAILPYLLISALPTISRVDGKCVGVFLVLFTVLSLVLGKFSYYHESNRDQLYTIDRIEKTLSAHVAASVFDGLQLFPRLKNQKLHYVGPYDDLSNGFAIEYLKSHKPEMIIYTARLHHLEPELTILLKNDYEYAGIGYWIRKGLPLREAFKDLKMSYELFGFVPPEQGEGQGNKH